MTPNPFLGLLHSRKFWLLILDTVVSFTTYFVTKYAAPEMSNDILYIIGGLQPMFLLVINSIAREDVANTQARADIQTAQLYKLGENENIG